MLIVISPAKALDFTRPDGAAPMTTPQMVDDIAELSVTAKKLKVSDLKKMMDLSDKLAELNRERFAAFDPAMEDGLQAAFAFNGDVYSGLKARELDKKGLNYAQKHLRILSGLYGVLRPLDAIRADQDGARRQPLRLLGRQDRRGAERGGGRTQGPDPGELRQPGILRRR